MDTNGCAGNITLSAGLAGYKGREIIIDLNVFNGTVAMFKSFPENLPGH